METAFNPIQAIDHFFCPEGRISRKAMETHCGSNGPLPPLLRGPEGRISRKAMETSGLNPNVLANTLSGPEGRISRKAMETRVIHRPDYSRGAPGPEGRISRKAMETFHSSVIRFFALTIVRKDELAERQWRRQRL